MSDVANKGITKSMLIMLLITLLVIGLAVCLIPTVHAAEEDVTTWKTSGTCQWGIDPDGCLWIRPADGVSGTLGRWEDTSVPWLVNTSTGQGYFGGNYSIKSVVVKGSVHALTCENMFQGLENCTTIDLSGLDTSRVEDMHYMFYNCKSLEQVNIGEFDTGKVKNMGAMFYNCSSLTSLDVSHFNTSNATDMSHMFNSCSKLEHLDVSNFDTSNATNMENMFASCSSLTSLDVSKFNTVNVTNMRGMFSSCSSLTSLDVSHFDTKKVTNMAQMFYGCSGLTSIDVSGFNTSNVTGMSDMFSGCKALTSLDVSRFDTGKVNNMERMFVSCSKLQSINIGESFSFAGDNSEWINMYNGMRKAILPTPTGDGYSGRWRLADDDSVSPMTPTEMRNAGTVSAGTWVWDEGYDVKYYSNNNGGESAYRTDRVSTRMDYSVKSGPNGTEYVSFNGWNTNADTTGTHYDAGQVIPKSTFSKGDILNLYAEWKENEVFTVEYFTNNTVFDSEYAWFDTSAPQTSVAYVDESYGVEDLGYETDSQRCVGWNTASDGSGTHYDFWQEIPANTFAKDDVLTLYGEWAERGHCQIVYDYNDGTGRTDTQDYPTEYEIYVLDGIQAAGNKRLVGWNTSADGTGTHLEAGATIPANTYTDGSTVTFYAELADGFSSLQIICLTDIRDMNTLLEDYVEMQYDEASGTFVWQDSRNNHGECADGEYSFGAFDVIGYNPAAVYRCTNYTEVMSGSGNVDELNWEITNINPSNINGKLPTNGETTVLAILYEVVDPNIAKINATLLLNQNASVPNATIAFTAAPGAGIAAVPGTSLEVLAPTAENGVTGVPTLGTAAFTAGDATVTSVDGVTVGANQKAVVKPVSIDFNGVTFAQPGIFRYLITEPSAGAGLTYDTQLGDAENGVRYQRVLDVYVQRVDDADTGTTSYQIAGYVFHEVANAPAVGADTAADKSTGFVHEYDTKTVTLESRAAGNQSSIDKYFAYTITIQNPNDGVFTVSADWTNAADALNPTANPATKYDTATITAANTAEWTSNADGSLSKTIYLRNGQKVELDGIPAGATYSVTVADEDYSPSWTAGDGSGSNNTTGNRVLNALEDVVFTLTREGVVPTGVMLSAVPGLIIMAGALIAVVAMRKRKEGQAEA